MMSNEGMREADDSFLEPLNAYKTKYEEDFRRNCKEYFDGLVEKSGMNVEENRATVKEYLEASRLAAQTGKALRSSRLLRGFSIFFIVVGAILSLVSVFLFVGKNFLAGGILVGVGVLLIVLFAVLLGVIALPRIKKYRAEFAEQTKKANEILERAQKQMAPLNALFENNVTKGLIEKTVPLLRFDDYFDVRRCEYLREKYGYDYEATSSPNISTIGIVTGEVLGNPFVEERHLVHRMGMATYTGSIVIHWETHTTDSEGHTVIEHHSETLTATVSHPKPYYSRETQLVYGNEAAPDLHFSRKPSHAEDLSDSAREGKVKRGAKRIRKKQEAALKSGASYTEMGNEEFEVLFGALDRDNDVQFRLLFTPLAQKNMLALIKDKEGFGDDFYMRKSGCLNYIVSEHSAQWDMDEDCKRYRSYSVDDALRRFLQFNEQYFKSIYFDLAPLMSIPLYQQHKPHEYIYHEEYPRNFTVQESEYAVNHLGESAFAPRSADTPSILKTHFLARDGGSDRICVTASAYNIVPRVDYVSVYGGDGNYHDVPVEWDEYVPISADTVVGMKAIGLSEREFSREADSGSFKSAIERRLGAPYSYAHGILCCILRDGGAGFDEDFNIKKN